MSGRRTLQRTLQRTLLIAVTAVVAFVVLWPMYWILISSLKPPGRLFSSPIEYFSLALTLDNYRRLFSGMDVASMATATGVITAFSLVITMVICTSAGYAFARFDNKLVLLAFGFVIFSAMVPFVISIVPMYVFIRAVGLVDTYAGLVLLYTSHLIPFTVAVMTGFIKQIPVTIEEAAEVDGAGTATIIVRVIGPLLKPAIATITIINFIICMNEFFIPLIFTIRKIVPLAVGITKVPRDVGSRYVEPWDLISAMGILIMAPIVIFVVIFEKRILSGLMAGSIKE